MAFWGLSEAFLKSCGVFWCLRVFSGASWCFLVPSGVFMYQLRSSEAFWGLLKPFGALWSLLSLLGGLWHSWGFWVPSWALQEALRRNPEAPRRKPETSRMPQKAQKDFLKASTCSRSMKTPEGTNRYPIVLSMLRGLKNDNCSFM